MSDQILKASNTANTITLHNDEAGTFQVLKGEPGVAIATMSSSGFTGNVTGNLTGNVTFPDGSQMGTAVGRNKIIGGDFTLNPWQRGTSFTGPTNAYTADRFAYQASSDGVVNVLKTTDAPTASEAGVFTQHCLHVDVTTADATIASGQYALITHRIEGYNSASFGFGQSGTRYVTLSFWVKSTKTGIFCASLENSGANRCYVSEYTVNVTNTWEKKTITFPVDTSGTWLYDSGNGLSVRFALACGSTYQTAANSWAAGGFYATANQVNALDNVANDFKIALVQLESGSVATPFESRPYGQELALCQRYYWRITPSGANKTIGTATSAITNSVATCALAYPVTMRIIPSLEQSGTASHYAISMANVPTNLTTVPSMGSDATQHTASIALPATSGHTAGQAGGFYFSSASGYLGFSAEL